MDDQAMNADVDIIMEALALGMSGKDAAAYEQLKPIIDRGPGAMGACLGALASMCTFDSPPAEGEFYGLMAFDVASGEEADINDVPRGIRFAAQYATAIANGDFKAANALFRPMLDYPDDLAVGFRTVFDMAVASTQAFVDRNRAQKAS